ncbi:MAG: hypothetical protein COB38_02785 [Gammaproteobacteria bacterium]|nr:MAG: hypothetical protein COB38_02785 [Gammaproteobacteria bacterium]
MSEQRYDIVYAGAIKEGFSQADVKALFVQKFKLSTEKVERYFSGNRMVLKKSLSKIKAENLKEKLMNVGAETLIVPCIGVADTNNAKAKNRRHEQMSQAGNPLIDKRIQKSNFSSLNSKQTKSKYDNEKSGFDFDSGFDSEADKSLNQKIKLAQSMLMEQQLKSQISESNSSPKYTKLVLFLIVLAGAVWFLLDIGKNSL